MPVSFDPSVNFTRSSSSQPSPTHFRPDPLIQEQSSCTSCSKKSCLSKVWEGFTNTLAIVFRFITGFFYDYLPKKEKGHFQPSFSISQVSEDLKAYREFLSTQKPTHPELLESDERQLIHILTSYMDYVDLICVDWDNEQLRNYHKIEATLLVENNSPPRELKLSYSPHQGQRKNMEALMEFLRQDGLIDEKKEIKFYITLNIDHFVTPSSGPILTKQNSYAVQYVISADRKEIKMDVLHDRINKDPGFTKFYSYENAKKSLALRNMGFLKYHAH